MIALEKKNHVNPFQYRTVTCNLLNKMFYIVSIYLSIYEYIYLSDWSGVRWFAWEEP